MTDTNINASSRLVSGVVLARKSKIAIAQSGEAVSNPQGGTSIVTLATVTIPGGTLGKNGSFEIEGFWTNNNSGNSKTAAIKINGTQILSSANTTNLGMQLRKRIHNRNATNSQVTTGASASDFNGALSTGAQALAFDTEADLTITFHSTLANVADTHTLESYRVIAYPGS